MALFSNFMMMRNAIKNGMRSHRLSKNPEEEDEDDFISNDILYNNTDYSPKNETESLNYLSHLLGKNLEINPNIKNMQKKIFLLENINALISFMVIIGSMMEYEFYYFKNYYELDSDKGVYIIRKDGDINYKGNFYRMIFTAFCLVSVLLTVISANLEFKMKKLQGVFFADGKIRLNHF